MRETDEQLYSRFLAEGNSADLAELLERHRDSLTLFLFGIVHDMEDAEDLMLDAFAHAASGARFSGRSSFKTWLFSIGKNLAYMHLRKRRPFLQHRDAADEASPSPELSILKEERKQQLYQAIQKLHEDYRQILILLYFEDMSCEEAGRVMGKNRRQVYHLADRGKAALKTELERMGFELT
ncbi:MAG: RNA polymerase sigma factor [Clostridia bacterium]|nr:RNA polymerase sigma factor [Clostridia bacterium]